jgi:hypothetical protein
MSDEISFTLGAPTKTLNELRHMHHRVYAQHRAALALEVSALTVGRRPVVPFERARVVIERHSVGAPDEDGLIGGTKPLLDVLQTFHTKTRPSGLGIIASDAPGCLTLEVRAVKAARGAGKTVVTITEME